MKSPSILAALLTISLLAPHPSYGQKMLTTNTTAPPTEAGRQIEADRRALRLHTAQVLAETEAAMQTNLIILTSPGSDRGQVEHLLRQQRLHIIRPLISLIESTNSWEVKDAAARVLGNYRALEAIPCLVGNIQQDTIFKDFVSSVTADYAYPFGAALANIGEPAVSALLERISMEDEERVTDRCREVIVRILGKQRSAEFIQSRVREATDTKVKQRFERVLARLQN